MEELEPRGRAILQVVVEAYIDDPQPVSSAMVATRLQGLSPATVRSVMAELEEAGLLRQPHTSAGRIPTEQGLRVYLDTLLSPRLHPWDRTRLDAAAAGSAAPDLPSSLVQSLAGMSGQMAVVAVPRFIGERFREVALVRYDERRFLAFFVSPAGLVQQTIVELDFEPNQEQLTTAQNFLNEELKRVTVSELKDRIRIELAAERVQGDNLRRQMLEIGDRALPRAEGGFDLFVEGASHLVGQPEFADVLRLKELLHAIEDRAALLELVGRILDGSAVRVLLGSEHHIPGLNEVACVGSSFVAPSGKGAAVTVLGPPRMDYSRLVPLVEYAARLFTRYWQV